MEPHEYDVLETLQRLINHYGWVVAAPPGTPKSPHDDYVVTSPRVWEHIRRGIPELADVEPTWPSIPPRHGKSTWPPPAHTAVLYVDGSPCTLAFAGGVTASDLAALVRAAGLGAEAVGDTVRLSPGYTDATFSVTPPALPGPPNRAQRRLRLGKRPPDTSAKNAARHRGPHGGRR